MYVDAAYFEGEEATHFKVWGHSAVSCEKMAELIQILFGFWALMGPGYDVLDGGLDLSMGRAILRGERAARCTHCGVCGRSAVSCAKTAEPIEMLFGLCAEIGSRNHV